MLRTNEAEVMVTEALLGRPEAIEPDRVYTKEGESGVLILEYGDEIVELTVHPVK